jgi:hypothetical protein
LAVKHQFDEAKRVI